ncbi:ABC transporter ATP-binding protein [Thermococcus sp.]|uniref:ABC transporter ATP-binding protein n=1 Tax=Thermococcus sp. TaxID=35749 RepID=UPI0026234011|nr:ABC transporter ATP-binding protein [Thermococcus sp.]
MIEVENLTKRFGGKVVLKGISFTVHDGEIYGLLGPNGSGKSTTMRILAGIIPPSDGKVVINGINVAERPMDVKRITGYIPETPLLYESLTPMEFFSLVGSIRGIPKGELEGRVERLVSAFGIGEYIGELIGTLSFGTRQKVSIIAGLLHDPEVLIFDEAINGLDPKSARIMKELLNGFKEEGKSIAFSTHVLAIAEAVCDRIGIIYNGELIAEGTPDELKSFAHEENLEDVFLKLTQSQEEVSSLVRALREAF